MRIYHLFILFIISFNALAAVEYKKFNTPQQEEEYKILIEEIRCLVCQNQTIADSNADLAKDLRRQVYEMLLKGQSKDEIADFMTQRYGDFVLYNPPFKFKTGLLWMGPIAFLLIGLIILIVYSHKNKTTEAPDSNADQSAKKEKIKALLEDGDRS